MRGVGSGLMITDEVLGALMACDKERVHFMVKCGNDCVPGGQQIITHDACLAHDARNSRGRAMD